MTENNTAMALSVRRPSDWSIVLVTAAGHQISFDRENRRISTNAPERNHSTAHSQHDVKCRLCHQTLPNQFRYDTQAQHTSGHGQASTFLHPEYFGLLASCLEDESVVELEDDILDDHLSTESFNQGYCDRFFVEERPLGRGGKGEVVKVRHILEGVSLGVFALKRVPVGDSQAWLTRLLREVQCLRFKHPNLVSYNHVWLEHAQRSFGPRIPVLHILQEYCNGGDLESYLFRRYGRFEPTIEELKDRRRRKSRGCSSRPQLSPPGLSVTMISSFFQDILAGVAFLHEQGVIHRDLKSSNCLLDTKVLSDAGLPRVLVSDFGEAQFDGSNIDQRSGGTGTLSYTAPEVVRGESWTTAADMFSLGIILYFMTHEGNLPYRSMDDDYDGLRDEILHYRGFTSSIGISRVKNDEKQQLEAVLTQLLSPEPSQRPSCADLINLLRLHDQNGSTPPLKPTTSSRSSSYTRDHNDLAVPNRPPLLEGISSLMLKSSEMSTTSHRSIL